MSEAATQEKPVRPVPKASSFVDTAPFWEGCKRKELWLQYCPDTGRFQHYPRPVSIWTGKRNLEWRQVSGAGVVYAATVIRIPGVGLDGRLPLSVATIDLDEGVRLLGNITNAEPGQVTIGARVEIDWELLADDIHYPAFRLV